MAQYTTANVPRKITHRTRERESPYDVLIPEWRWTPWVLAITPKKHDSNFRRRKTHEYQRPGYKITKAELTRQFDNETKSCGVYEWMARHTATRNKYVVYIGSTCRSKSGNFIDRIYEYCSNGSHKADLIDSALERGYELLVHFKGSGDTSGTNNRNKASAECDENAVLRRYDYAWNVRSVKQIERSLPQQ